MSEFVTSERERAANRARKERYRGTCETCGAKTTGCNGPRKAPRHCHHCAPALNARRTPEAIIAAIKTWAERFGGPPTAMEWNPAFARWYARKRPDSQYAARLLATASIVVEEDWPRANTVVWRFGSFSAGLRAAGFEPGRAGRKRKVPA